MIKKILANLVLATLAGLLSIPAYAEVDGMVLIPIIKKILSENSKIKKINDLMSKTGLNQLDSLKSIQSGLLGTHEYGGRLYDSSAYDWGDQADDWQKILVMSKNRNGSGNLSSVIGRVANQFPVQSQLGSTNSLENEYYDLQASTAIATRSGSELAFNQAVKNEKNIRQLHREIDQAPDAKSAADLNNRLASENAMLSVQQTKLLAMIAQQAAVEAQARAIRAQEDKTFFNIK